MIIEIINIYNLYGCHTKFDLTGIIQHALFPPIYNNSKLCLVLQFIIIVNCRTKIAPQHLDTDELDKKKLHIYKWAVEGGDGTYFIFCLNL